jgi:hypothetical protein
MLWQSHLNNEIHCRVRKNNAPQNFAILRYLALNLLNLEGAVKAGIKAKRLQCGYDADYRENGSALIKVLYWSFAFLGTQWIQPQINADGR